MSAMTSRLKNTVYNPISKIKQLVPIIDYNKITGKRKTTIVLINAFGDLLNLIGGMAASEQVDKINHILGQLKRNTELAHVEAIRTREGYLSATRLTNARMDKLDEILQQEYTTVNNFHQQVVNLQATSTVELNSIALPTQEL